MNRQYGLTGDAVLLQQATLMERMERRVWRHFHVVIYPSEEEASAVRALSPQAVVRAIVPFCFDTLPARTRPPKNRTLLFVGGFSHAPNVDAARYFVQEVLPLLRKDIPDVQLILAGSNPTNAVRELAGPAIHVTGYVPDEELQRLYDTCRASVVPLRFGAGVKGKVVEALSHGLPLVTTSIGAQGIEGLETVIPICDGTSEFVTALKLLLTDEAAWIDRSNAQADFARWRFSPSAMRSSIEIALQAGEAAWRSELVTRGGAGLGGPERPPQLSTTRIATFADYERHAAAMQDVYRERQELELGLVSGQEFEISGFCVVCGTPSTFHVDFEYAHVLEGGRKAPNWRERLSCRRCTLNSRSRAAFHFLNAKLGLTRASHIYLTEQVTPFFRNTSRLYPNSAGSEYLQNKLPLGCRDEHGIRNEDITCLTFPDEMFDAILTFDVLEHVPDYDQALRECWRCLKQGGTLLLSVPFDLRSSKNSLRARRLPDDQIEHLLAPEYHGDPIGSGGILCYHDFGWELLDNLRSRGFQDAAGYFFWSRELAYLGIEQFLFVARKI